MSYLRAVGRFWWNFVVGDDWRVAAGIALALILTWLLLRAGADPWWLLPIAVVALLTWSLWRAAREAES